MRPQSAKAKGRRLQQWIAAKCIEAFPHLSEDDVRSTSMGASGEDVLLSCAARKCIPLSIEAKNQERLNIWSAIDQCNSNKGDNNMCIVMKRNNSKVYATIEFAFLLDLLQIKYNSAAPGNVDRSKLRQLMQEMASVIDDDPGARDPVSDHCNSDCDVAIQSDIDQ